MKRRDQAVASFSEVIARGFDVWIGAPLDRTIGEGLLNVAAEVAHHCPTGALCFDEKAVAKSVSASS